MPNMVASPSPATPMPRRHIACQRCRRRKQRCDGLLPACANCCRAGVECVNGVSPSHVSLNRLHYLENRVRELEAGQRNVSSAPDPTTADEARGQQQSPADAVLQNNPPEQTHRQHILQPPVQSPSSLSVPGSITRDQPLAHEVGLLSLANASDPKYLGPSSGVPFARLIYASAPQSQGLSLPHHNQHRGFNDFSRAFPQNAEPADLPAIVDCQQFAEAFFEVTLFLPFLLHDEVFVLLDQLQQFARTGAWSHSMPVAIAFSQVFLLLSLGARLLETKLKTDFNSNGLLASGMRYADQLSLYDSAEGIQTLLLITLNSFYNPNGLNAWFLMHTIIASCLDLGLQRRDNNNGENETDEQRRRRFLRSGIFWSAYSLDRTLTTILGRPLTLRDEAIDVGFPGVDHGNEVEMGALEWAPNHGAIADTPIQPYLTCIWALRFDRIVAEIKLMLYRVSRSPNRFPWPTDMARWQQDVEASCRALVAEVEHRQRVPFMGSSNQLSLPAFQKLQLKHHQCLMLLYRPSPQIPRPSREATQICFNSALETIRISADLHRFTNMDCTWLSAHSIFVAAITIFYCLWTKPDGVPLMVPPGCLERLETAQYLLQYLSETWSVAKDACEKLSSLLPIAREVYNTLVGNVSYAANYQPPDESQRRAGSGLQNDAQANESTTEYWSQQGAYALVDELGILRDLFDLGWLDNATLDPMPLSQ